MEFHGISFRYKVPWNSMELCPYSRVPWNSMTELLIFPKKAPLNSLAKISPKRYVLHWSQYHNSYFEHSSVSDNGPRPTKMVCIHSTPEGRAVSVTRELDLSLVCRIWLFGRHLVSLAKIAEVWPPFFLATETPDIALEDTSREIWSE